MGVYRRCSGRVNRRWPASSGETALLRVLSFDRLPEAFEISLEITILVRVGFIVTGFIRLHSVGTVVFPGFRRRLMLSVGVAVDVLSRFSSFLNGRTCRGIQTIHHREMQVTNLQGGKLPLDRRDNPASFHIDPLEPSGMVHTKKQCAVPNIKNLRVCCKIGPGDPWPRPHEGNHADLIVDPDRLNEASDQISCTMFPVRSHLPLNIPVSRRFDKHRRALREGR